MLTPISGTGKTPELAQIDFDTKLAIQMQLGWEMLGTPQHYETDNGYVISVQMTPKRKDESDE